MTKKTITEAEIAEAAFYIWLDEGKPAGRSQEHWDQAKAQLETAAAPAPKKRAPAKPKTAAKPKAAPKTAAKSAAKPKAAAAKTAGDKPKTAKPRAKPAPKTSG